MIYDVKGKILYDEKNHHENQMDGGNANRCI